MMHHLNTLYVTTQKSYLHKDGEAVAVSVDKETKLRVPLHNLGGIVCFGNVSCSPFLMGACAEAGVALTFLTENGKFLGRFQGFTPGNVLLRKEQYRRSIDPESAARIAKSFVSAKIANCRVALMRAARDNPEAPGVSALESAARRLGYAMSSLEDCRAADRLRGLEGDAAKTYFDAFDHMILAQKDDFKFEGRNRRPPTDKVNCLLSFMYTLLAHDVRAACEAAGLDAAVGFLHTDRPGRPGLALDLMEELRPFLADRLVLSLINRQQISAKGFKIAETGAVTMDDDTRKAVLVAWQKRKQEELLHPFLNEKCPAGLVAYLQARLLSRHLRGDMDAYPPFFWK